MTTAFALAINTTPIGPQSRHFWQSWLHQVVTAAPSPADVTARQLAARPDAIAPAQLLLGAVGSFDRQRHRPLIMNINIVGGRPPGVETVRSVLELPQAVQAADIHAFEQQKSPCHLKLHTI